MKKLRKSLSGARKNVALALAAILIFGLTACGAQEQDTPSQSQTQGSEAATSGGEEQENPGEGAAEPEGSTEAQEHTEAQEVLTDGGQEPEGGAEMADGHEGNRVLVAYFSATGNTKRLAEYAAEVTGADLYEIVPEEPYTDADLDYNNRNSRTSIEMNDKSIKPAISGSVSDMAQYEIVFIAYPIWWGDAPHIMDTFMESYDFSGKTIVSFCTSGSSGIGSSAKNLHGYTDDSVTWLDGARLKSGLSKEDMADWIRGLFLGIEVK